MLKESYIHQFSSTLDREGVCHIAVYYNDFRYVVICTEVPDNPGPSVTNAAEYIATDIWHDLGAPEMEHFVWLEHYMDFGRHDWQKAVSHEFDRVTFTVAPAESHAPDYRADRIHRGVLREPDWHTIDQAEVERLIGMAYTAPDLAKT